MKKRIAALGLALAMVMGTVALAAGAEQTITVTPMTLNINGQDVTRPGLRLRRSHLRPHPLHC